MTRRLLMLVSVFALAGGIVSQSASADHCEDIRVIVFGRANFPNPANPSFNMGAVGCELTAVTGSETNLDYLQPGSVTVSLRLVGLDLGRSAPRVPGTLNGLGNTNTSVTLERQVDKASGAVTYDSSIPYSISGTGEITAIVKTPEGDFKTTYRTVP